VISVHGGDVFWTVSGPPGGAAVVSESLAAARLVLANSHGIEELARRYGAKRTEVVHLGADPLTAVVGVSPTPLIVSVAHLIERKRHADVVRALVDLPGTSYLVIGDGPERGRLEALALELGVAERVEFAGQLAPALARERMAAAWCMVLPSIDEAFGVAYIEALAAGVPAIGCLGEPGPAEIAASGEGIILVPARDPAALAQVIAGLLSDEGRRQRLSAAARATVAREFTWQRCGERTLAAYSEALR
jgi:glycosyltransferase involved in cell wall biosynthesis